MGGYDQPVRAALGHVMLGHQRGHHARQLVGECGTGGGVGEADLGVERERRDLRSAAQERSDLANDPHGHGDDQVLRRLSASLPMLLPLLRPVSDRIGAVAGNGNRAAVVIGLKFLDRQLQPLLPCPLDGLLDPDPPLVRFIGRPPRDRPGR